MTLSEWRERIDRELAREGEHFRPALQPLGWLLMAWDWLRRKSDDVRSDR